jgi:glycerol-3-phosphate dehydrogenase
VGGGLAVRSSGGLGARDTALERLAAAASEPLDVLVVGGGITGAGAALDAAARGLRVGLVERSDFASGTSSKSSKLVHGGLRYLQQGDVRLVREAVAERDLLRRLAPHLVEAVPFVVPLTGRRLRARMGAGLWAYDALAAFRALHPHRHVRAEEARALLPPMRRDPGSGYLYYDCKTDDVRLVLEVLVAAVRLGAVVCNHCEVSAIQPGPDVCSVAVRDTVTDGSFEIRARSVVVAAGVWADRMEALMKPHSRPRLTPSKGVHLVFDRNDLPISDAAVLIPDAERRRLLFVVPWLGRVLVGTTDTSYDGDLDEPSVEPFDYAYCLDALNASFDVDLTEGHALGAFAGLRPLVAGAAGATADLSRRHLVRDLAPGVVGITGGKLTTFRRMAADAVGAATRALGRVPRCRTRYVRLGCSNVDGLTVALAGRAHRLGIDDTAVPALVRRYGDRALAVLDIVEQTGVSESIAGDATYVAAESIYSARAEMAVDIEDFMARRARLALTDRDGGIDSYVVELFAAERGWTERERRIQEARYLASLARERSAPSAADKAGA